jgi:hypothetical protein
MMFEPTRNDRCSELPRTIGCTVPPGNERNMNPGGLQTRLDSAQSSAMMHALRKAAADGLIINYDALGATIRMTCWT